MFTRRETAIPGLLLLHPRVQRDERGSFVKTMHEPFFRSIGLSAAYAEQFYTVSSADVLRGMHFQRPPHHCAKLVTCITGSILDVVLDLRAGSAGYGRAAGFVLNAESPVLLHVPVGCAHGFLVLGATATVHYSVTSPHVPALDDGVAWDSFGYDWPIACPTVSERDRRLPPLGDLVSPFHADLSGRG